MVELEGFINRMSHPSRTAEGFETTLRFVPANTSRQISVKYSFPVSSLPEYQALYSKLHAATREPQDGAVNATLNIEGELALEKSQYKGVGQITTH